jgi:hypothetical protein
VGDATNEEIFDKNEKQKNKDEITAKWTDNEVIYVDAPGLPKPGQVKANVHLQVKQWIAVKSSATGTDKKTMTKQFTIHHKADSKNGKWVLDPTATTMNGVK